MKYMGVDYGSKRVGIAVSNDGGTIAFPRGTIVNDKALLSQLVGIGIAEKIEKIIVGDTRSHGGGENPVTAEAERFIDDLAKETGLPVSTAFEVFSSIEASRYAPPRSERSGQHRDIHDDSAAAAIILQRFLDMNISR